MKDRQYANSIYRNLTENAKTTEINSKFLDTFDLLTAFLDLLNDDGFGAAVRLVSAPAVQNAVMLQAADALLTDQLFNHAVTGVQIVG